MTAATDTRAPLNLRDDHCPDVSGLRFNCSWSADLTEPGCGPDQRITNAYESTSKILTGATSVLVHRCAGCGQIINGSTMQSRAVTRTNA